MRNRDRCCNEEVSLRVSASKESSIFVILQGYRFTHQNDFAGNLSTRLLRKGETKISEGEARVKSFDSLRSLVSSGNTERPSCQSHDVTGDWNISQRRR